MDFVTDRNRPHFNTHDSDFEIFYFLITQCISNYYCRNICESLVCCGAKLLSSAWEGPVPCIEGCVVHPSVVQQSPQMRQNYHIHASKGCLYKKKEERREKGQGTSCFLKHR